MSQNPYSNAANSAVPARPASYGWERLSNASMIEVLAQLWNRKLLMTAIFLLVFIPAIALVMTLKKTYTAQGKVLVQFGEEYIYNPVTGVGGQGAAYSADQMIQAEVGFITAAELKEKVLERIGLQRLYPKLAAQLAARPEKRTAILGAALHNMEKALGAFTAPNQPLVTLTFRHRDPQVARDVLNAFIDEYQVYRRKILLDGGTGGLEVERQSAARALRQVNEKLEQFLTSNGIGDFVAERTALGTRIASLRDQLLGARAHQREIEGALSSIITQMAQTPRKIEQYQDDAGSGQLAALKLQRQQLLAKYTPQSGPVQEINARITRLEHYTQSGLSQSTGTRRTGLNTVFQGLHTRRLSLEAERQSNTAKITVLGAQINTVRARQQRFQKLFPQYQRLANQAQVMETSYVQLASREQDLRARRNLATLKSDNIRVIERPVLPVMGKSLKKPAALLAFFFAAFSALSAGVFSTLKSMVSAPAETIARPGGFAPARPAATPFPAPPFITPANSPGGARADLPVLGNIAARP